MKVIIDIEANALVNPTQIWLIVCKDIETGEYNIFRNLTTDDTERNRFLNFSRTVHHWIGHNLLGYDWPVLVELLKLPRAEDVVETLTDTLILSKLVDYPRSGHSVEHYGEEFGYPKGSFSRWNDQDLYDGRSELFLKLEEYCIRDVDITHKIYLKYRSYLMKEEHNASIRLEHQFQLVVNTLHKNGFSFNLSNAKVLLKKVEEDLSILDKDILISFPPREVLIREFTPKATKHGTISRTSVPRSLHPSLHLYEIGKSYRHTHLVAFNPSSHKQLIEVLNAAGWQPTDKTQTHIDTEREIQKLKYTKERSDELDLKLKESILKLEQLEKSGWKINENNLSTLPSTAPSSARTLAKRILLESRRRTLTEWIGLCDVDGRIHGRFYGIGAWTHRMAHQQPNTANIPNDLDTQGVKKLLGKELRSLWQAPKNRLLVGVDAEGIQLRIFAHYIDDKEFTDALVNGRKHLGTDPHSLNQRVLGDVCKTRQAAKRFIYALLLGAGIGKLAQILEVSEDETKRALDRLMERYQGFTDLKEHYIPADAKRGWFLGLDGRRVRIPGETAGLRKHLCMSGYLQNGEQIIIKSAGIKAGKAVAELEEGIIAQRAGSGTAFFVRSKLVNIVHDEYVIETPNDVTFAKQVQKIYEKSIEDTGIELKLKCPLAGTGDIGLTWSEIH